MTDEYLENWKPEPISPITITLEKPLKLTNPEDIKEMARILNKIIPDDYLVLLCEARAHPNSTPDTISTAPDVAGTLRILSNAYTHLISTNVRETVLEN